MNKEIKIRITPQVDRYLAPMFDHSGFPTEIWDIDGSVTRGLHSVERLRERFDKILASLEKVQSSASTVKEGEQ